MDKKNIILVVIAVILFCVAVGVIISVINDTDVQMEENIEEIEELEEKIDRKINEIKRPTTEGIDDNVVEGILSDKNAETKNQVIGTEDGVSSAEEELVYVGQNEANKSKDEIKRVKKLFNLDYNELESALLKSFEYDNQQMVVNLNKLNSLMLNSQKIAIFGGW